MKRLHIALLTLTAAVAAACTGEEQYTRSYPCNFLFYTDHHPASILKGITSNAGTYVWVTARKVDGIHHVYVYRSDGGKNEDWPMTTEIENNRISYDNMGANNELIIGCTTANEPKAYDRQCPYCLENLSGRSYPLEWTDTAGVVRCAKCGSKYDMNANGISPNGKRMLQYRIMTGTGYDNTEVLRVTN